MASTQKPNVTSIFVAANPASKEIMEALKQATDHLALLSQAVGRVERTNATMKAQLQKMMK